MKNTLFYLVIGVLMISCQPAEEGLPEDLNALKDLQRTTKTDLSNLEKKLADIEEKMAQIDPTVFERPKKLVTGLGLTTTDFKRFIELQGAVKADETVYVSSETGGRITSLTVKDGDYVKRGALIARIDLEALDKQLAEIEKSLELAKQVYERQERLWNQNIGTELQYLQAKNNVERLEKSIETLEFQKTKSSVYAPISGEVSMINKELGEVAAPGEPIATLLNVRKLNITVDIPENLLPAVSRGDLVNVQIPAIEYENQHRIKRIGAQVNPTNRTIPVEVPVYNSNGLVKPNLLATMQIQDMEIKNAITIPTTLLQQEVSGKYFVYTIETDDEDNKIVEKKLVQPGESYEGQIVITEGLTTDQVLVDKGSRQVSEGDLVIVESVLAATENNSNNSK